MRDLVRFFLSGVDYQRVEARGSRLSLDRRLCILESFEPFKITRKGNEMTDGWSERTWCQIKEPRQLSMVLGAGEGAVAARLLNTGGVRRSLRLLRFRQSPAQDALLGRRTCAHGAVGEPGLCACPGGDGS